MPSEPASQDRPGTVAGHELHREIARRDGHIREELVEQIESEYARRSPEGRPASRLQSRRVIATIVLGLSLTGLIITVILLKNAGGWMTAALGAGILIVYYVIGWSPEWLAATQRASEHEQIEAQVVRDFEIKGGHDQALAEEAQSRTAPR